LKTEDSTS